MKSLLLAIAFVILAHPQSYIFTDQLTKRSMRVRTTYDNAPGVPTIYGLLVHAVLFWIIAYGILRAKEPSNTTTYHTPIILPPRPEPSDEKLT